MYIFLSETASTVDSMKRKEFASRMRGEMNSVDPESFKGLVPRTARFVIDTIPEIPNVGERDSLRRTVAYVRVTTTVGTEDWYLFCAGDSLWRLEALRRFPSASSRAQIRATLSSLDTSISGYGLIKGDLERLLMTDDTLCTLLRRNMKDVQKILEPLRKGTQWRAFVMREVDFARMEEYRELDDDIGDGERIFYSMDRQALERLKRSIGLQRIDRDVRFPKAIFFVAGLIGPGSYGYVYAADPGDLPPVTRHEFITLKPAAAGWWLYRRVRSGD